MNIDLDWPPDGDPSEFAAIARAEQKRASELAAAGVLRRLWRVPGRHSNWGLWDAPDPTALHTALTSLPFFPWLTVNVHALGTHPYDPEGGTDDQHGRP